MDIGKEKNVQIFRESMDLCKENRTLADAIRWSVRRQIMFPECNTIEGPSPKFDSPCTVSVTKRRTLEAASRCRERKTAVLNFASWRNPGGGVRTGAFAQEESLCRISTLYPCLSDKEMMEEFYLPHREDLSHMHNGDCIYTPRVVVFRSDSADPKLLPEKSWFKVDVLTCAAPSLRDTKGNKIWVGEKHLLEVHRKRIGRILDIAALNGAENVILGAFGCGVFMNDPEIVAIAARMEIEARRHLFRKIEFAVYCGKDTANYEAFRKILS